MILRSRLGVGSLGDTASVQAQVVAAANTYGVPPALALAVAKQESGFNQSARSSAGAIGVMQLIPSTAKGLNVDPTNEAQNIDGGVRLLSQLLQQYNGDTSLALAAYNAGPSAVAKYNGVPPYPETQDYVSRILADYGASGASTGSVATVDGSDTASVDSSAAANPSTWVLVAAGVAAWFVVREFV